MNRLTTVWLRVLVFTLVLSMTALASAQEITPIEIGQNLSGEVSGAEATVRFALTSSAAQTARLALLSLSSDYFPTLRVTSPSGIELLNAANTEEGLIVEGSVMLGEAGVYVLEVGGSGGTVGQFVISVQPGAPLPSPVDLVMGAEVTDTVDAETPQRLYRFESVSEEELLLSVTRVSGEGSPIVAVRDETAAQTLSTSALGTTGMTALIYRFAAGVTSYLLEVDHSGSSDAEAYRICLWRARAPGECADGEAAASNVIVVSPTAQVANPPSATPSTSAGCTAMSATGGSINVRRGPDTSYPVVGNLSGSQSAPVIGRLSNSAWYQISYNGQAAWVGSTVVTLVGNCGGVSVVSPPALPTAAATTPPGQATATAMMTPTATLTAVFTATMTATATATATEPGPILTLQVLEPVDMRPDLLGLSPDYQRLFNDVGIVTGYRLRSFIRNIGYSASGPFTARICIDGICSDQAVSSIEGNGPTNLSRLVEVNLDPITGTILYELYIDIYNDVNETDDTNNLVRVEINLQ